MLGTGNVMMDNKHNHNHFSQHRLVGKADINKHMPLYLQIVINTERKEYAMGET